MEQSDPVLASASGLEARLTGVIEVMFSAAGPYHAFAGSLFASAASPSSPLNPFSADFTELRDQGIDLFARVAEGSTARVPDDLASELPFLLWTVSLGMLYCWMHDHSEHQEKTRTVLRHTARLLAGLIRLSSAPGAGHFRRQLVSVTYLMRSSLPLGTDDPA
jgi:hypothetical protein